MSHRNALLTTEALADVRAERARQDAKWGANRSYPMIWDHLRENARKLEASAKASCEDAKRTGLLTWSHILSEEVAEAFAAETPEQIEAELIQVAAVAVAAAEDMRRKRLASEDAALKRQLDSWGTRR